VLERERLRRRAVALEQRQAVARGDEVPQGVADSQTDMFTMTSGSGSIRIDVA
jgi:hypothetical protein